MSDHKTEYFLVNAKLCSLIQAHPCMYDRSAPNYMKKEYVERAWAKISQEVNDTVFSCKERWRNIRTAYARSVNIYKTPSGPNRHKRYYLHDELQFLTKHLLPGLPSLRVLTPLELDENHESSRQSIDQSDDNNCTFDITLDSPSPPPSSQEQVHEEELILNPETEPELEPEPETEAEPEQEPEQEPEPEPEPDYVERFSKSRKRRREISEELPNVSRPQKRNLDSEFLNSLLPEMKTMNTRQKILFKGKIFQALEEVFSDSKDFPQNYFQVQGSTAARGTLKRRTFGNKVFIDRREKQHRESPSAQCDKVQLAQSGNKRVCIKQETDSVEVDD